MDRPESKLTGCTGAQRGVAATYGTLRVGFIGFGLGLLGILLLASGVVPSLNVKWPEIPGDPDRCYRHRLAGWLPRPLFQGSLCWSRDSDLWRITNSLSCGTTVVAPTW